MAEHDMLAGELALGLLEGDERAQAMRRTLSDPTFAREVEWWRSRLSSMLAGYSRVPAPAGLIDDIGIQTVPNRWSWLRYVVPSAVAASAAILLVTTLRPATTIVPPINRQPPVTLLAVLDPSDGTGKPIAAVVDRGAGQFRVAGTDIAPDGKAAQLWAIQDGVPRSLGLLSRNETTLIALPATGPTALQPGLVLAISIEPLGGSPKPTPTGPVVATGPLSAI
ncbi:MAG: anti-sigma factor [Sphingomonas paucimobilis]